MIFYLAFGGGVCLQKFWKFWMPTDFSKFFWMVGYLLRLFLCFLLFKPWWWREVCFLYTLGHFSGGSFYFNLSLYLSKKILQVLKKYIMLCIISGGDIVAPYVSYLFKLSQILKMYRIQNHITIPIVHCKNWINTALKQRRGLLEKTSHQIKNKEMVNIKLTS